MKCFVVYILFSEFWLSVIDFFSFQLVHVKVVTPSGVFEKNCQVSFMQLKIVICQFPYYNCAQITSRRMSSLHAWVVHYLSCMSSPASTQSMDPPDNYHTFITSWIYAIGAYTMRANQMNCFIRASTDNLRGSLIMSRTCCAKVFFVLRCADQSMDALES